MKPNIYSEYNQNSIRRISSNTMNSCANDNSVSSAYRGTQKLPVSKHSTMKKNVFAYQMETPERKIKDQNLANRFGKLRQSYNLPLK